MQRKQLGGRSSVLLRAGLAVSLGLNVFAIVIVAANLFVETVVGGEEWVRLGPSVSSPYFRQEKDQWEVVAGESAMLVRLERSPKVTKARLSKIVDEMQQFYKGVLVGYSTWELEPLEIPDLPPHMRTWWERGWQKGRNLRLFYSMDGKK